MTTPTTALASLRRPRLLIRAARFGLMDYDRTRTLRRIFGDGTQPGPSAAVGSLIDREAQIEARRKSGDASYSVARHVEVLVALMGEARLLPRVGRAA